MTGDPFALSDVLNDVRAERRQQDARFGEQNHLDGTGDRYARELARVARIVNDRNAADGSITWSGIMEEEFWEALSESDPARLRDELVQVAAVACAWVESIDRRKGRSE